MDNDKGEKVSHHTHDNNFLEQTFNQSQSEGSQVHIYHQTTAFFLSQGLAGIMFHVYIDITPRGGMGVGWKRLEEMLPTLFEKRHSMLQNEPIVHHGSKDFDI